MPNLKEIHKVFYMVKGYITDDDTARECYNGYTRRLWYNEEAYRYEDGFEEAYKKKLKKVKKSVYNPLKV